MFPLAFFLHAWVRLDNIPKHIPSAFKPTQHYYERAWVTTQHHHFSATNSALSPAVPQPSPPPFPPPPGLKGEAGGAPWWSLRGWVVENQAHPPWRVVGPPHSP